MPVDLLCRYSIVRRADNSELLLVATERTASVAALLGTELEIVATFTGKPQTLAVFLSGCFKSYKPE